MSASAFKSKSITEQQKVEMIDKLTMARRNLSLFQHHDAITGTSRVNVMENYGQLLWSALNLATEVLEQSSSILLGVSKENDLALVNRTEKILLSRFYNEAISERVSSNAQYQRG
jgi:hypothetical protein